MNLAIEPPNSKLPMMQLINSSIKNTFANILGLGKLFIVPVFFWCLGFQLAFSSSYYSYLGKTNGFQSVWFLLPIALLGLVIQFIANWKIALVSYSVSKVVLDKSTSIEDALRSSEANRLSILKLSCFVCFTELVLVACACLAQFLTSTYYDPKGPLYTPGNMIIAFLQFIYYSTWLPHMGLYALNAYLLATASQRSVNFADGADHFLGAQLPSSKYFFLYLMSAMGLGLIFLIVIAVEQTISFTVPWSHNREVLQDSLRVFLFTILSVIYFAYFSIAGAFLSKQRKVETVSN